MMEVVSEPNWKLVAQRVQHARSFSFNRKEESKISASSTPIIS